MSLRALCKVVAAGALVLACGSEAGGENGPDTAGNAGSAGTSAMNAGGMASGGTASGSAGMAGTAGGTNAGGTNAAGGVAGSGAGGGNAGAAATAGASGGASGGVGGAAGGAGDFAGVGGSQSGAAGEGGSSSGAAGLGGAAGMGGASGAAGSAGTASGGAAGTGGDGCPASGNVTYTLTTVQNPSADELEAYELITEAMDEALEYYNCYTNITKPLTVQYNPGVATADGNNNGSIRFGGKQYMEYSRAMHEIAHSVGIGTYQEFHDLVTDGIFTGEAATAQVRLNTGNPSEQVHADSQHFWPGGLNYASEAGSEKDVIDHCLMVVAIRKDMGFDP